MKKQLVITIIVAVILLGGGVVYVLSQQGTNNANNQTNPSSQSSSENEANASETPTTAETEASSTITFTDNGFDKASYSVKAGSVVTVKNESNMAVQFSSDDHPTHREHPEINMEELEPGESGTLTPTTKGTYKFHDHINDQYTGTLVVE